jgi:hypothetical protein
VNKIFSPDIEVVKPEHLGLPRHPLGFVINHAGLVYPPKERRTTPIDNGTSTSPNASPVVLELKGIITGVGILNLTHYCQPVIDRLGYIRDVIITRRELGIQVGDSRDFLLSEIDASPSTKHDVNGNGKRHDVTVHSRFGYHTHLNWENGEYLIGFHTEGPKTTDMKVRHLLEVVIQICVTDDMARIAYVNQGKKEEAETRVA